MKTIFWLLFPAFIWATEDDPDLSFGGHSRDFHSISDSVDWQALAQIPDAEFRHFRGRSIETPNQMIQDFIESHKNSYNVAIKFIKELFRSEWVSITSRIKSFISLKEKMIVRGVSLSQIKDVIGIRLTFQTVSDVRKAKTLIEHNATNQLAVQEVVCYGICKEATMIYSSTGYRRIHLLVLVLPENKWAEIQLGTPYSNLWADWSHDFLYKGQFSQAKNRSEMVSYMIQLAEYLFQLDEARNNMPVCIDVLRNTPAVDVLPPLTYEYLHRPPNLCLYWTDIFISHSVMKSRTESTATAIKSPSHWQLVLVLLLKKI